MYCMEHSTGGPNGPLSSPHKLEWGEWWWPKILVSIYFFTVSTTHPPYITITFIYLFIYFDFLCNNINSRKFVATGGQVNICFCLLCHTQISSPDTLPQGPDILPHTYIHLHIHCHRVNIHCHRDIHLQIHCHRVNIHCHRDIHLQIHCHRVQTHGHRV